MKHITTSEAAGAMCTGLPTLDDLRRNRQAGINSIVYDPLMTITEQQLDADAGDLVFKIPQATTLDLIAHHADWMATRRGAVMVLQPNGRPTYLHACALVFDCAAELIVAKRLQTVRLYPGDVPVGPFLEIYQGAQKDLTRMMSGLALPYWRQ